MAQWTPWKIGSIISNNGWSDSENIRVDNGLYAYSEVGKNGDSGFLGVSSFSFDDNIPVGSIINDIEVDIKHKAETADCIFDNLLTLKYASSNEGNNKASAVKWSTSNETITYGGATDKWGW